MLPRPALWFKQFPTQLISDIVFLEDKVTGA
jgi:hypothetical protein